VEVSTSAISVATGSIQEFGQQFKESKSAIVISSGNAEETSPLYELLRTGVPATVRLFQDMEAARAWLGLINDNPQDPKRRSSPRKEVRLEFLCSSGLQKESTQLVNISLSGALLESRSLRPAEGSLVKISFEPPEVNAPFEITGVVVRTTQNGFAIQPLTVTNELVELVGDPS
jgi:hypothetical protein